MMRFKKKKAPKSTGDTSSGLFLFDCTFYRTYGVLEVFMGLVLITTSHRFHVPAQAAWGVGICCILFGWHRIEQYMKYGNEVKTLTKSSFFSIPTSKFDNLPKEKEGKIYIGQGFEWQNVDTQRYLQLLGLPDLRKYLERDAPEGGRPYLHNLGRMKEDEVWWPVDEITHTVLAGATRVGKTRLLDNVQHQLVRMGMPVIIVDPKGDFELLDNVFNSCQLAGNAGGFRFFSLAHPSKSETLNPLANYTKVTDIASRIKSILPEDGDSAAFTNFCWHLVHGICDCLEALGRGKPFYLRDIHRYVSSDMEDLLEEAKAAMGQATGERYNHLQKAVRGLKEFVDHDREWFGKMSNNLRPYLTALAEGEVGQLLSPAEATIDWEDVLKHKRVVYIYLGSMADSFTSEAVGKLIVQDLLAFIGRQYAQAAKARNLYLIVDELYSVYYSGYIEMLNKAGGAGLTLVYTMQTTADVEEAGTDPQQRQVMGNTNNKIMLRTPDYELSRDFAQVYGKVKVLKRMKTRNVSADPGSNAELFKTGFSERVEETDADLISPEMLAQLPKGQAFTSTQGRNPEKIRFPLLVYPDGLTSFTNTFINPDAKPLDFAMDEGFVSLSDMEDLNVLAGDAEDHPSSGLVESQEDSSDQNNQDV